MKEQKFRCQGKDIHPDFRENYCGRQRANFNVFPCNICDLKKEVADDMSEPKCLGRDCPDFACCISDEKFECPRKEASEQK